MVKRKVKKLQGKRLIGPANKAHLLKIQSEFIKRMASGSAIGRNAISTIEQQIIREGNFTHRGGKFNREAVTFVADNLKNAASNPQSRIQLEKEVYRVEGLL